MPRALALFLAALAAPAAAFPSSFTAANMSLPAVSARGQAFGRMSIPNYENATDPSCAWTHNVPNTGYVVGTEYKLWIGNKAVNAAATVGIVYNVGTAANEDTGSNGSSKVAFKEIDWTATDAASVELKAICGAGGTYDKMWIADPVTLTKASPVNCTLGPAVAGANCQAACGVLTQTIATPASNGGTACGARGTHTCANGEGQCVQAKCSTVASAPADFCGSGKVIDATKSDAFCAVAACNKATAGDLTACCKATTAVAAAAAKCLTVKTTAGFCGVNKVYDDAKDATDCAAAMCSKDTPGDVTACCKKGSFDGSMTLARAANWASALEKKFAFFLNDTMAVPTLQSYYDDSPIMTTAKNGKVLCAATATSIQSILDNYGAFLSKIATEISAASTGAAATETAVVNILSQTPSVKDMPLLRTYFARHDSSTLYVDKSTQIDDKAPLTALSDADPRQSGWYANAVAGPKDLFFVLDLSGGDSASLAALEKTLGWMLSSVSAKDNIWLHVADPKAAGNASPVDATCAPAHVRGLPATLDALKAAVAAKIQSATKTFGGSPPTTAATLGQEWMGCFKTVFEAVEAVRGKRNILIPPMRRSGAIAVLLADGSRDPVNAGLRFQPWAKSSSVGELVNDKAPAMATAEAVAGKNTHQLPIFTYSFQGASVADSTDLPLNYRCDSFGSRANVTTKSQMVEAARFYDVLAASPIIPEKEIKPSVSFSGGLFGHLAKDNAPARDYGKADEANVLTVTSSVYDESKKLIGVVGIDLTLGDLKVLLDDVSSNLGRKSFPLLVTPHGDTIYHLLSGKFKSSQLHNIGGDIGMYEYFDVSTQSACCGESCCVEGNDPECTFKYDSKTTPACSFDALVREPLLRGDFGDTAQHSIRVLRALPAGDAATEGFDGQEILTDYFYSGVVGWDLRLGLSFARDELVTTNWLSKFPEGRMITSQLHNYIDEAGIGSAENKELLEKLDNPSRLSKAYGDGILFNRDNCKGSDGTAFGKCKPDAYCERVKNNQTHPTGYVAGAPACDQGSTCVCEPHRWPVGLTSRKTAVMHVAPLSLVDPRMAFTNSDAKDQNCNEFTTSASKKECEDAVFEASIGLTEKMTRFINRDALSYNPPLAVLRQDSVENLNFAARISQKWVETATTSDVHDDTVWLYYGTATGITTIYPSNNWGYVWDPTRRPWYSRAIASPPSAAAAISTPYVDGGGAGLMNTLAAVVRGRGPDGKSTDTAAAGRKVVGVVGFDFLYPIMNDMLPAMTGCAAEVVREIGRDSSKAHPACWLIELSGLLLTHSDFLASDEEKKKASVTIGEDNGAWPIENVFIGKKEPDVAAALIAAKVLVEHSAGSPDSKQVVSFFKVNDSIFEGAANGVVKGEIDLATAMCLEAPDHDTSATKVTVFATRVKGSNAILIIANGYRRKGAECSDKVVSAPVEPTHISQRIPCRKQQEEFQAKSSSWQSRKEECARCPQGSFTRNPREECQQCPKGFYTDSLGSSSCKQCRRGQYTSTPGQFSCFACNAGQYSFVTAADHYSCIRCPDGAECAGEDALSTAVEINPLVRFEKTGHGQSPFWRDPSVANSTCFFKCNDPAGCLGTVRCSKEQWTGSNGAKLKEECFNALKNFALPDEINVSQYPNSSANMACLNSKEDKMCTVARLPEVCAKGYEGVVCAGCARGYARVGETSKCERCKEQSLAITLVVLGTIGLLAVYSYLIISTMKHYGALEHDGIITRVIVTNVLIISQYKSIPLVWPQGALSTMDAGGAAGDPVSLINMGCLDLNSPYLYMKILFTLVAPFAYVVILSVIFSLIAWKGKRHWKKHQAEVKKHREEASGGETVKNADGSVHETYTGDVFTATMDLYAAQRFRDKMKKNAGKKQHAGILDMSNVITPLHMFKGSIVIMAYMLYPSLLKNTFGMLDCVPLSQAGPKESCYSFDSPETACTVDADCSASDSVCLDNGLCGLDLNPRKLYFRSDPSIECYDSQHKAWLGGIFAPSILLYCLGIPVVFFLCMRKQQKFIAAGGPSRAVWGFISAGFESTHYYWELIIIMRKQCIIFIVVFMTRFGTKLACVLCIMVLTGFLLAHMAAMPFEDDMLDVLEKMSLVCSILTICIAMLFDESGIDSAYNTFWIIMLICTNLSFYGLAGYMYWQDLKQKLKAKAKVISDKLRHKEGTDKNAERVKEGGGEKTLSSSSSTTKVLPVAGVAEGADPGSGAKIRGWED